MAERSLSLAKIRAYDDIKRMIRFLQEEQESIDGANKKRHFFRKNIETIFENNFKGKLPIEEYESIIFDICIAKKLILGDTNEAKIGKKIEDAILHCNIRNKELISEKISMAVADDPRTKARIKAIVESKYREIVTPLVSVMVRDLIPEKEIDSREIIARVKEERYDLDTVSISKIFTKELKIYQEKNRGSLKRDFEMKRRLGKSGDLKQDSRAPGAKTNVEKMTIIVNREKERKEKYVATLSDIAFKLSETYLDDNIRVFVHTSDYKKMRILIISYAQEGEIDNVSILFEPAQGSKGSEFFFDLGELNALDEKVTPTFIKSKLGLFSRVLSVNDVLEVIWFLTNVLKVERKLPLKSVEFIQDSFLIYLETIETEIHKATVQKAIR
ncbi:hypothetical protein IID62_02845 [candidate division KSB1 bacterium]|nr:hypothetical protein [candidate division KSB1 bacterium]